MKMKHLLPISTLLVLTGSVLMSFVGCEGEPPVDSLDRYFQDHPYISDPRGSGGVAIQISPSDPKISVVNQRIAFRAKGGQEPYFWGVSDSSLGTITPAGERTSYAIYVAYAMAPNTIVVSDVNGSAATVLVQPATENALQIVPEGITLIDPPLGAAATFTVIGGTPPYGDYTVSFPSIGTVGADGTYVVQKLHANATNLVTISDAAGNTAIATVEHVLNMEDLRIVPGSATLSVNNEIARFVAAGGMLGMHWSVAYPERGQITPLDARTAEYQRLAGGDNVIVVRDGLDRTATATITQPDPTPPQIAPATVTLATNQTTYVFTASGGSAPYVWGVVTGGGTVTPAMGVQTVYTRGAGDPPNNYVIKVTDSRSQSGFATITQQ